jgi:hypothetical protein
MVGATYASLFPGRARALLLTAPMDVTTWVDRPFEAIREQSAGLERGLGRFFAACAAHQDACRFGGGDPEVAFDELAAQLDDAPIPAPQASNPRPVDGDDLRVAALESLKSPLDWPDFAAALVKAQQGDGSGLRVLVDRAYERTPDGDAPFTDVNWVTLASDQRYPDKVGPFLEAGRHSASLFPRMYFNSGYSELAFGLRPFRSDDAYRGPFRHAPGATPALVIGTTYDTFTPFAWAPRLVEDLGNARLLTYRGDGHDVLTSFDPCIVQAIFAYLEELELPDPGTICLREPPFGG